MIQRKSFSWRLQKFQHLNLKVNVQQWDANIPSWSGMTGNIERQDKTSMSGTTSWRFSLIKFPEGDSWQGQGVLHNCVCPKLSYPNFFAVWAGLLSYICCLSAFVHIVFTCAVAKKQNRRICKNTVLMETAFHSTSGFHLNPLIGENVTISVLLWRERDRERER